ncbi:thialysine N-epsilon-acetyltransferase-like isoform X3 [Bufo bufo]|uniref:thialysine N-epsilon-acetyltransferase-like isoform X3 n=1 Tax=Bufo bufo TaxID=8384 RepID=UPI001ABDB189|nr:thialysine N-epsilon-acetyltransferase-like isoform X3 [Bufo bufo]
MAGYRVRAAEPDDCEEIMRMIQELAEYEKLQDQVKNTAEGAQPSNHWCNHLQTITVYLSGGREKQIHVLQISREVRGLRRDGFGSAPLFRCLVVQGEDEDQRAAGPRLVGYALSFFIYSTWEGRSLHLEDLYIMPEYRGKGIGSKLFSAVAESCLSLGCSRLQLSVLDWNHTAISFYRSRGARDLTQEEGWRVFRFIPEDLKRIISKNSN